MIQSEWGRAETGRKRKYYSITQKGAAMLETKATEWKQFATAVTMLLLTPQPVQVQA